MATFTMYFNANGGTNPPSPTITEDYEPRDGMILFTESKPTPPEGYHFSGWNTQADGSGISVTGGDLNGKYIAWVDGKPFPYMPGYTYSVTLYAQWAPNQFIYTGTSFKEILGVKVFDGHTFKDGQIRR